MDDVLDPADKEELAKKIESSDFAKDLVHQTRDSVRRLRLSAPQVIGSGMGMDPNTVAEYLDNVLPPDQVGDYERICLDSDLHLAETAACHHVLTMVLGEPAEVEPRARQRMYMVPAEAREQKRLRTEPAHKRPGNTTTVPILPPLATQTIVATPAQPEPIAGSNAYEIPEYLRSRPWWQSRAVLASIAAVLLVGAAFYFVSDRMGLFGGGENVAAVDAVDADAQDTPETVATVETQGETETGDAAVAPAPEASATPGETVAAPAETPSAEPAVAAPAATTVDGNAATTGESPQPPATEVASPPAAAVVSETPVIEPVAPAAEATAPVDGTAGTSAPVDPSAAPAAATTSAEPGPVENPATPDAGATTNVPPPGAVDTTPPADPVAVIPPQENSATDPADTVPPAETVASLPSTPAAAVVDIGSETADDAASQGPPDLGTYLSGKTVLLRHDEAKGGWFRAQPRSAVVAGDQLLALPEFRPKITLASGVVLDLSGGTQVVMMTADMERAAGLEVASADVPLIDVLYGRIILINTSGDENLVRVKAGSHVGEARLERNATLGVEVERPFVPGNDPRTTPSPVVVRMYAPEGGVTWKDASNEFVAERPSRWTLTEGAPGELVEDATAAPEWIDQEPVVHLSEQRYGAPVIESTLVSDRPVDIQLLELFKGRDRREVKSLVTRASIHVGLFAPFVEAIRDSEQKWQTWRTHIATLRSAMAQSTESAEQVFQALVEQRGRQAAADLYEMLCGYNSEQIGTTPEQMKTGALARLVGHLENDSLDYRVLAVHDLWEITGKQLMPNPSATPATRKINVRNFRNRLESGELVPVKQE
jgi:hypothetical protein